MREKESNEHRIFPQVTFDRLTTHERIVDEYVGIEALLNANTSDALAQREAELDRRYRKYRERSDRPRNKQRLAEIKQEIEWIDYFSGHYRYRARDRKEAMAKRPHELWLDISDEDKITEVQHMILESPRAKEALFIPGYPNFDREREPSIVLVGDYRHVIKVPTTNLVHAFNFSSWENGRNRSGKRSDQGMELTSREVIDDYASRDTPPPPVGEVLGYIQPNGMISYLVKDGAHRAAAAIKRGDEMLSTTELRLVKAEYNLLQLPE